MEPRVAKEARQFDYNSISDVILTIRYTAKDSNKLEFKQKVNTKIKDNMTNPYCF
jgi:hypothetical protein